MRCEQCGEPTNPDRRRCRGCVADGRPVGVRLAAALAALGGLGTALVGLELFASGTLPLLSPFVVALGLAQVAVARGLWRAEYWAWGWGVTLYAVNALLALGRGVLTAATAPAVTSAVVAGLIGAYIYGHHARFTAGEGPAAAGR